MKMKRFLIIVAGVFLSWILVPPQPPRAEDTAPLNDCHSCPSFGVQRFTSQKEAPPFCLKALDGTMCSLTDLRGKPVLLFFWGSWCISCKEDLVLLEKFAQGKKDQLVILTICVDGEREKRIRKIVKDLNLTLPVLLVLKEKVIDTYEVRMVPSSAFINREGHLVGKTIGQRDWSKPEAWSVTKELLGVH